MKQMVFSFYIMLILAGCQTNQTESKNMSTQPTNTDTSTITTQYIDVSKHGRTPFPFLDNEWFRTYISDNQGKGVHFPGYNGVAALIPHHSGQNIFVPYYAGLNYETLSLQGNSPHPQRFEPRAEPMHIESVNADSIVLVQPTTAHSHVSANIRFRTQNPYYLFQTIELTFHKRFAEEGEKQPFSSLWASYMEMPKNINLYLQPYLNESNPLEGWYEVTKASHSDKQFQMKPLPADSKLNVEEHVTKTKAIAYSFDTDLLENQAITELPLRYYYGFLFDDLVYIQLFKQPERTRFAYSPTGGGWNCNWVGEPTYKNPAWDYVLHLDDVQLNKTYRWETCVIVKPWKGREDVIEEYKRFME